MQVVIALIVTPEGFPLAYEVLPGNTADKTTLREFLQKIDDQYGKAERIWVMDRGIPTEEVLAEMRPAIRPSLTWWARPRAASPSSRSWSPSRGSRCARYRRQTLPAEKKTLRLRAEPGPDRQRALHAPSGLERKLLKRLTASHHEAQAR